MQDQTEQKKNRIGELPSHREGLILINRRRRCIEGDITKRRMPRRWNDRGCVLLIYICIYIFHCEQDKKEERIEERAGGINSGISFVCVST